MQKGEEQDARIKGGHRFTVGVPRCDKFSVPYSAASGDKYHLSMVYVGLGQLSHREPFLTVHLCQLATGGAVDINYLAELQPSNHAELSGSAQLLYQEL